MKRLACIFFYFIAKVSLTSCCFVCENSDDPDATIVIKNVSDRDIVFFYVYNIKGDTAISLFPFPLTSADTVARTIYTMKSRSFPDLYKANFRSKPDKTLMVYLFSRDTIEQVPWEKIKDNYIVLKRYDLTLDSLEKRNWLIKYP